MFNRGTVRPSRGNFSYTLRPGFIYTFTTTTGEGKGSPNIPAAKTMPLPYTATPDASNEPTDLGPEDGSFEYVGGSTTTFEQTTVNRPVFWQNAVNTRFPYAVVGGNTWKNYTVNANITFTGASQSAGVISRFNHPKADGVAQRFYAYQFTLAQSGQWKLVRNRSGGKATLLASGTLTSGAVGSGTPVTLSLTANGSKLTAAINGTTVKSITDKTYAAGDAGISTGGWYPVQFNSLKVTK